MPTYIYQHEGWPKFRWSDEKLAASLAAVSRRQGRLIGHMEALGFKLQDEAVLATITEDVVKSSEIEGEHLDKQQVRSSVARRLGINIIDAVPAGHDVEGVVEMMLDATQKFSEPLTKERLFRWHASLFPTGQSGMAKITVGGWRTDKTGPMQVVSGAIGHQRVHFEAPPAARVDREMRAFLKWFEAPDKGDALIRAAVAHLWFVTIHPFEDGNGRIARAIADMALARSEDSPKRFYSMSGQIRAERKAYYDILERTQKDELDITPWLAWFLGCLDNAISGSEGTLSSVLSKARFWDRHAGEAFNDRQRLMLNKLLNGFEGKLTSSKWATIGKCSQDTASRDIDDLIKRDILMKEPGGGRSTSYALIEIGERHGLTFPDKDHKTDSTRGVIFCGEDGKKRIRCIISREALDDHFSDGDRLRPDAAFEAHRAKIEAFASRKYARGQLEPDGGIIIRTEDLG